MQLDAFDADGQISADLIRYCDGADKLAVVDRFNRALAAATTTDQVKEIHDLAVGMAAYAKRANDKQLEADAEEIRMKATRRLGEMMKAQKETIGLNRGALVGGLNKNPPIDTRPTLAEAGIDKNLAHAARTAAAMAAPEFEAAVIQKRKAVGKRKPKARAPAVSEQDIIDSCCDDVAQIVMKTLARIDEPSGYRRLATSLRRIISELVMAEPVNVVMRKRRARAAAKVEKATAKPKKQKSKSKRRPAAAVPNAANSVPPPEK